MTSLEQAKSAIIDNLYQIFGEPDAGKRKEALLRIWAGSDQCVFVDPEKTYHSHAEISDCVEDLQKKFAGWVYTETSPVTVLPASGDHKVRFAKVQWGYGPPGEAPKLHGEDVAVVMDGRMQSLCASIDGW